MRDVFMSLVTAHRAVVLAVQMTSQPSHILAQSVMQYKLRLTEML